MKLETLLSEEDAVSPVIGVILMVAITVILAAVIASFVLGLGSTVDSSKQASFTYSYDDGGDGAFAAGDGNDEVTIRHSSGDELDRGTVSVIVDGTEVTGPSWPSSEITAGDSITVQDSDVSMESGDDIRVVWTDQESGTSSTLTSSTVP